MDRLAGTTVLTGTVIDQAHLHGLLDRIQELGIELVSFGPVDDPGADDDQTSLGTGRSRPAALAGGHGERAHPAATSASVAPPVTPPG